MRTESEVDALAAIRRREGVNGVNFILSDQCHPLQIGGTSVEEGGGNGEGWGFGGLTFGMDAQIEGGLFGAGGAGQGQRG